VTAAISSAATEMIAVGIEREERFDLRPHIRCNLLLFEEVLSLGWRESDQCLEQSAH